MENKTIFYLDILRGIASGSINPEHLFFTDNKGYTWYWNSELKSFINKAKPTDVKDITFFLDVYNELDFPNVYTNCLKYLGKSDKEIQEKATESVVQYLVLMFLDKREQLLSADSIELSDDDIQLLKAQLGICEKLVKMLGGDVTAMYNQSNFDHWYHKQMEEKFNKNNK